MDRALRHLSSAHDMATAFMDPRIGAYLQQDLDNTEIINIPV